LPATGEHTDSRKPLVGDHYDNPIGHMAVLNSFLGVQFELKELPGIRIYGDNAIGFINQKETLRDIFVGLHSKCRHEEHQDPQQKAVSSLRTAAIHGQHVHTDSVARGQPALLDCCFIVADTPVRDVASLASDGDPIAVLERYTELPVLLSPVSRIPSPFFEHNALSKRYIGVPP
jgi:hypothetical protein